MGISTGSKINHLLTAWPPGTVQLSSWLRGRGYSNGLLKRYRNSMWMHTIGRDANVRTNNKVDWTGGLHAIQYQLRLPVHAGGKTALQLLGRAHFVPMGKGVYVTLFSPTGVKLPAWFLRHKWDDNVKLVMTRFLPSKNNLGFTEKSMGAYSIILSTPERAILEVLYQVPHKLSYEESKLLMTGLHTLRPELTQKLLIHCRSVKVKRLFMHLAELCKHPWVEKLDLRKIYLGRGKRVVVAGGHFDAKYEISVPGQRTPDGSILETQ